VKALAVLLVLFSCAAKAQDAIGPDGSRYWGPLRDGAPNGYGRLVSPDGSVYTGEFRAGLFHGRGTILLRNGQVVEGLFVEGHLPGRTAPARGATAEVDAERRQAALAVETALLRQRPLLDAALAGLAPREPGRINLYVVAVGGDGTQDVFRREAEFVRGSFDQAFGTRGRSLVLANGLADRAPMATLSSLREALQAVAARMDREQDILFLYLTSHGTGEHELVLGQGGMMLRSLRAADLAAMLRESGIRWKAVVLSACYAGGFLDALRDEGTLAIAAARRDRQSFGCTAQAELTWFGHAFLKEALPGAASFQDAFRRALPLVAQREARERIAEGERSLPQMQEPRPVAEQLARWWSQSRR
jgi:hypothetical protein